MRGSRDSKIVKTVPRSKEPLFGLVLGDGDHGSVLIPKSKMNAAKDPVKFRAMISDEYTKAVQKYPDVDFSILVDPNSDDIKITWRRRKD